MASLDTTLLSFTGCLISTIFRCQQRFSGKFYFTFSDCGFRLFKRPSPTVTCVIHLLVVTLMSLSNNISFRPEW